MKKTIFYFFSFAAFFFFVGNGNVQGQNLGTLVDGTSISTANTQFLQVKITETGAVNSQFENAGFSSGNMYLTGTITPFPCFSDVNESLVNGMLRIDPPGGDGGPDDGNQTGAVGEGLLILTVLAGGHFLRKRKGLKS